MIDEKKLIERLENIQKNDCKSLVERTWFDGILAIVESQPRVGEWIPVEEGLPEEMKEVPVWFEYYRYGDYNCLYQTMGISYVIDGKWSYFVNGTSGWKDLRIIAWMDVEPYRKEKE